MNIIPTPEPSKPGALAQNLLTSVWQRSLPTVRQRLGVLSSASHAAMTAQLSDEQRKQAADVAHKFAGSLGMFGYPRGTEIAQQLELLLEADGPVAAQQLHELTSELASVLNL